MNKARQHIKVYVNDDWLELLRDVAGDRQCSISEVVRHAVASTLGREKDIRTRHRANGLSEVKAGRKPQEARA